MFDGEGSGRKALSNLVIMDKIVHYLSDEDLNSWDAYCKPFNLFADDAQMDAICWKKRALKLANVIETKTDISLETQFSGKAYKEIFSILKINLDNLVRETKKMLKGKFKLTHTGLWDAYSSILETKTGTETEIVIVADAASFAHHGMLGKIDNLDLRNLDLSSIPADRLASLAACVRFCLDICNVTNTDLSPILDNVQCADINISRQTLDTVNTQALVRAMKSGVTEIYLNQKGDNDGVFLDISSLIEYDGKGKCEWMSFDSKTTERYGEEIKDWARRIDWNVDDDDELEDGISIYREEDEEAEAFGIQ